MINGAVWHSLCFHCDERGRLLETLRNDHPFFEGFGQAYLTTAYPGVVKAWHLHRDQIDTFIVLRGMAKIVLFDSREESATYRELDEFFIGEYNPGLLQIPAGVYHGFKCISTEETWVLNLPSKPYNYNDPDEVRLPPDDPLIAYNWARQDG